MLSDIVGLIPNQEFYESDRFFGFVSNPILRRNIALLYRYTVFLIVLEEKRALPGGISYSIYKSIIINFATIVEGLIHYCIRMYIDGDIFKSTEVMPQKWVLEEPKVLFEFEKEDRRVCGGMQRKSYEPLTNKTKFQIINRVALKKKLLSKDLFEKAESLRKKRNKIHLMSLKDVDNYYEREDVKKSLRDMAEISVRVREKLENINVSSSDIE